MDIQINITNPEDIIYLQTLYKNDNDTYQNTIKAALSIGIKAV